MSTRRLAPLAVVLALAACSGPPPAAGEGNQVGSMGAPAAAVETNQSLPAAPVESATTPAPATRAEADFVGKWTGPEGRVLDVSAKPGGGVTIVNQWTLDDKGSFDGAVTAEGLRWVRGGKSAIARPSNGDATGMKWLAGKRDCLTVAEGEGYCRD